MDVATTVCLVWTLKHTNPSFVRTKRYVILLDFLQTINNAVFSTINSLVGISFGSGGVTSVGAVLALVSYLVDGESNGKFADPFSTKPADLYSVWLGVISCLRPLYVLTMVANLVASGLLI